MKPKKTKPRLLVTYFKDYKLIEGKGFWLLERILVTRLLGITVWKRTLPVTEKIAMRRGKIVVGYRTAKKEFTKRQAAINYMNNEMERLGSAKRYK